ncbi:MAG: hypothetical protein H0U98_00210 [Alphaproteobacteria bacterium]|nr:hypothetical protein [Alphaproteobacteria bacterium]
MFRGVAALVLLMAAAVPLAPARAQGPAYQVMSNDPNGLEVRFRGMPIRGVHADDNQNALSIDFAQPVDGAAFDRLSGDLPQWISMAYAIFDNGVIRSPRPVTFLTRNENDGFSLRIVPRGGPPPQQMAQAGPPPPPPGAYPPPGPYTQHQIYPAPAPYVPPQAAYAGFHTYGEYAQLRAYEAQELALRRGDPMWQLAYARAAMQSGSDIGVRNETNWYHGGDLMIATDLDAKVSFFPGVALVGDVKWTDVRGTNVRLTNGTIANATKDIVTGAAGFAFELGRDSELKIEGLEGSDVTGAKLSLYSGQPNGFGYIDVNYHQPYVATPTAVNNRADTDNATIGYTQQLWTGMWGSIAGHYTRYGVHGDANVARTAGWDGNLRWNTAIWGGLLAGLSYDGHGEYVTDNDTRAGTAPTPFVPLGIRNMENHAVTLNLSSDLGNGFWFAAYAGWVKDRYASDGLLAGMDLHYTPADGFDLALGVRQSAVSYTQGERGIQLTAGLNLTVGMGAPPQPSWIQNAF